MLYPISKALPISLNCKLTISPKNFIFSDIPNFQPFVNSTFSQNKFLR